mgnify:CR=1 FL=1
MADDALLQSLEQLRERYSQRQRLAANLQTAINAA